MKFLHTADGGYRSIDGRVVIRRPVSRQTGLRDKRRWTLIIDGKERPRAYKKKADAIIAATEASAHG